MKEETPNQLIKKYKNGDTSLEEEEKLFHNLKEESEIKILGGFVKNNQIETPNNLNDKLWKSFDEKNKYKMNKFRIGVFSAAASLLLIISLYLGNLNQNKLSNSEKKALLNEAKNMFTEAAQTRIVHNIILESDLIVVYTKP